ncbi:MAG: ribosome maturation factor RimP [Endomicrobium sp.]|jgi:ribosome maturation factor RimP|nr:ribosome maturation factor RimP [Endomicrobium sp.]
MEKTQEIEDLLAPIAAEKKVEIVDVQYVKEVGSWVARIFIDKDGGVTMKDCENISYVFSAFLDKSDILKDSYILEISSPGPNRVLKKEESFKRFVGSKVRIQTFKPINNQRNFLGTLLNFKDGKMKINDVANGIVEIEFSDIKKANIETDV